MVVSKNGKIRGSWDGEGIEERRQMRGYVNFHSESTPRKVKQPRSLGD